MKRRVVVTGLGVVSPLGSDLKLFWHCLSGGQSGVATMTTCDTRGLSTSLGGEVADFDPTDYIPRKQSRRMGRATQFAVAAALMAVHDARVRLEWEDRSQIGVCMGTSIAGLKEALEAHVEYLKKDRQHFNPFTMVTTFPNAVSGEVAIALGVHGPCESYSIGCSSTANAVGRAVDLIQTGHADVVIAGGAEAPLHHGILSAMDAGRMLANDSGGTVMNWPRPFDRSRGGTVVSEGAGCLVLEEYEHACQRGARIYAEIQGWGFTCDAVSMARPDATGKEHIRAIGRAMSSAQWFPEDVDYVNGCGLGTVDMDAIETRSIKQALGDRAYRVPVTSFKGALGHAFAASGAFQLIGTVLVMQHQFIPPTLNWTEPDADCDLDYVPRVGRPAFVRRALVNSFGFGGKNIVIGLTRPNIYTIDGVSHDQERRGMLSGSFVESPAHA